MNDVQIDASILLHAVLRMAWRVDRAAMPLRGFIEQSDVYTANSIII